jgi:hypothetical protein
VLEGILVGIIDASLLRKAMQSCSGVDTQQGRRVSSYGAMATCWCLQRSAAGDPALASFEGLAEKPCVYFIHSLLRMLFV